MSDLFDWNSDGGVEMQTRDGAAAAPTPNVIAGIASGPSEATLICVCGKAEMDGVRCRFGASHRTRHPCGECHIIPGETCDICGRSWGTP